MGEIVRTERLPGILKNKGIEISRVTDGRATTRGLLLPVILFAVVHVVAGQIPSELTPDNTARLRRQIENGSVEEKRTALFDIRNLQSAEASAIALPALSDKNELVRSTAAASVVYLPKSDAVRALIPLLSDKAEFVRREAAHALGDVGDPAATTALIRLMEQEKILEVRTSAAWSLGRIGDPSAIESLLRLLRSRPKDEEEFLRRNAARSIGQIAQIMLTGERTVVTPQHYLPDKFKDLGPVEGSRPSGLTGSVDVLMTVLSNSSESDDTRREAAFALGAIGDARAIPALRATSSSADPYLVEIAREALLKIERRNAISSSKD